MESAHVELVNPACWKLRSGRSQIQSGNLQYPPCSFSFKDVLIKINEGIILQFGITRIS